jgi:asparagine synthase (glutamine-hydrolysing)
VKSSSADEYINKAEVIRLIDEHRKGRADNSRKIWTMLVFLMWFEIFFPDGSEEAPAKTGNRVYLAV